MWIFNLSALIFICSADSSPETYSTFPSPLILSHNCKIKVDLPIPGSPPTKISEPFTIPPPKTLSSSSKPVDVLNVSFPSTVFKAVGLLIFFFSSFPNIPSLVFCIFSSTKLFHSLHAGHFPNHFAVSYPQLLHTKIVFAFAIYFSPFKIT